MSTGLALTLLVVLLLGNAFFVAAEFAMVSVRRDQLEHHAAEGGRIARITLRGVERVSQVMATCQLGITACSLGLGAIGEPAVAHLLEVPFEAIGLPDQLVHPVALVIALGIVVFLHMVLGEMVPKNLALVGPDRSSLVLGPPIYLLMTVLRPVIWLLNTIANLTLRIFRITPQDEVASAFTRDEVREFVAESGREGLLDPDELALLESALEFETLTASDIAIPQDQLVTVERHTSIADIERLCAETGFSRFPVTDGQDLIGYVHLKDLLALDDLGAPAERYLHELPVVAADAPLRDVVAALQRGPTHLARLEGADGMTHVVALEDALEELVGEVRDATVNG